MKKFILTAVVVAGLAFSMNSTAFAQNRVGATRQVTHKTGYVKSQKQIDEEAIVRFVRQLLADNSTVAERERQFEIDSSEFKVRYDELVQVKNAFAKGYITDITFEEINESVDLCNAAIFRQRETANAIAQFRKSVDERAESMNDVMNTFVRRHGDTVSLTQKLSSLLADAR